MCQSEQSSSQSRAHEKDEDGMVERWADEEQREKEKNGLKTDGHVK